MPLVIVESPNKISKIKKILGNGYVVMSSVGHIMDLEKKNMGIDLDTFTPKYKVNNDKKDVVKSLKAEAAKHDEIYIATDSDREGEAIAFNIKSILPKRGKNIQRVIFEEITKVEVLKGMKNPIGFNEDFYKSQQARRMTDRLVGFKVSPVMWTKGLKNTSAGRVQSAILKWIVDREKEIRAFVEEEYWKIGAEMKDGFTAEFYGIGGKKYIPKNEKQAKAIVDDIKEKLTVTDYDKRTRSRKPYAPFITSTMQKDAGAKFKWTGKRTMDAAQSLFSQGLITYHRTDSVRNNPDKIKDIRSKIEKKYGKQYLSLKPVIYKNKNAAQDAHEAIRPTFEPIPMNLGADERKLLQLITDRFMASQMAAAKFDQASIKLEYKGKKTYNFRTSGSILQFDGFLKVYGSAGKDVALPQMKVGQQLDIDKLLPTQHFTKPPARYTSPGSLIDRMEKEEIGRPATYVATVETLLRHKYVSREKQSLKPTEVGIMVSDYLNEYFKELTNASFTAKMELELDEIAAGDRDFVGSLKKFYDKLTNSIEDAKKSDPSKIFKTDLDCNKCKNGKMVRKISKYGVFLGCENYPECGHVVIYDEDGKPQDSSVETGTPCPVCDNIIVKKKGKFGEFYGCSAYPTCTWTGQIDDDGNIVAKEKKKVEETDQQCPKCKKNNLVKREGRYGPFLGCAGYPKCKHIVNLDGDGKIIKRKPKKKAAKDTGEKCPKCNENNLVERDGKFGKFIACSGYPKCKHIQK